MPSPDTECQYPGIRRPTSGIEFQCLSTLEASSIIEFQCRGTPRASPGIRLRCRDARPTSLGIGFECLGITWISPALGVSQQAVTAYESGQRRVPISLLPQLADTLGVTVEDLIGVQAARGTGKRGPAPKLQQQLERITRLPKAQQRFVMQMIDTVLQQQAGR